VEVPLAFCGHVADDSRNRRLFYHGEKKAVEYREVIQAVCFIQKDFGWAQFVRGPARRAIDHINPIYPG